MLNEKVINGKLKVGSIGQFTIDTSGNVVTSGTLTSTSSSNTSFTGAVYSPILSISASSSETVLSHGGLQQVGSDTLLWYGGNLVFKTGSTGNGGNRFQFSSAGTLGVGSGLTQFQVDSNGNIIKINNVATSFPSSQGGANTFLKNDGSGNLSWAAGGSGATGTGATGQATFWTGTSTVSGDNAFWWDNTNKRIGIGTNAPLTAVHIVKAAAPSSVTKANTYLHLGGAENSVGSFRGISAGYLVSGNTNVPAYIAYNENSTSGQTNGDWVFATRSVTTDTLPTERMRIRNTGQTLIKQGQFGSQTTFGNSNIPAVHIALSAAPSTLAVANSYIHLGGSEFGANSFRGISAGYLAGALANPPAVMAFQEINGSGNTFGDWVFYTRSSTSDVAPTERLRIDNAGAINVNGGNVIIKSGGIQRWNGSSSGYFGLKAAATTTSKDYTWPAADGSSGQFLKTDGLGVMTWSTVTAPSATTSAAGSVQLATQAQAWAGTPDTSSSVPLVVQPSGQLFTRQPSSSFALRYIGATGSAPNSAGNYSIDIQTNRNAVTQVPDGVNSGCLGYRNQNSGANSFAVGHNNVLSGTGNFNYILGDGNTTSGTSNARTTVCGNYNTVQSETTYVLGESNTVTAASYASNTWITVVGTRNTVITGTSQVFVAGDSNTNVGTLSLVVGRSNNLNSLSTMQVFGASNSFATGGTTSTVLGSGNTVGSTASQAGILGYSNNVSGTQSFAVGYANTCSGSYNYCFGYSNTVSASVVGVSIGRSCTTTGNEGSSFGNSNTNAGAASCLFGKSNSGNSVANVSLFGVGNTATSGASQSSAFGRSNTLGASASGALAFGDTNTSGASSSTAVGCSNTSNGSYSSAIGYGNSTGTATTSSALGRSNTVTNGKSEATAVGSQNTNAGSSSSLFGRSNSCNSNDNTTLVGRSNVATTSGTGGAAAFGVSNTLNTTCDSTSSIFGTSCSLNATNATVVGYNNTNPGYRCNLFGNFLTLNITSAQSDTTTTTLIGFNSTVVSGGSNTVAVVNAVTNIGATSNIFGKSFAMNSTANQNVFGKSHTITASSSDSEIFGTSNSVAAAVAGSIMFGRSNTTNTASNTLVGTSNTVSANAGTQSSVFGFTNTIGDTTNSAKNTTTAGYRNLTNADNSVMLGYGNCNISTAISSVSVGILNNNNTTATLNASTGVITGGAPAANASIGINSTAVGVHCNSNADRSTAIGFEAKSRVTDTINFGGLPIIRKDNGETAGNEFRQYAGTEVIIMSKQIAFNSGATQTITLPTNARFFINEVGLVATNDSASIVTQPFVEFGITGNNTKYLTATQTTTLSGPNKRAKFLSAALAADDGEQTLTATISTAGSAGSGRFYWKGIVLEDN